MEHTKVSVGDSALSEVTSEPSQLEQVSKDAPDVEQRLGPDDSEPIDEPPLRDRLHILALGVTRMIEARLSGLDLDVRGQVPSSRGDGNNEDDPGRPLVESIG